MASVTDDDVFSVATFDECGDQEEPQCTSSTEFEEEAVSLQRLVVNRLLHEYTRGHAHVAVVDESMSRTPEKMFKIESLYDWTGGDPEEIVNALRVGRVRARLNAGMGTGKTTKLGPYIAKQLSVRVLVVSLDALCLQQVAVYAEKNGLGRFRRNRSKRRTGYLGCMTYADFNGHMIGKKRSEFFADYDVLIFDEAFVGSADVYAAKRFFSAYSLADTSLILASATIQAGQSVESMKSKNQGNFRELANALTVREAIATGKLCSEYLVDRTGVFVADDGEMRELQEHYLEGGVDCRVLDSAASYEDLTDVCDWLQGDSTVPRVLVLDVVYGIGFNIPLSYLVIWPFRRAHGVRNGRFETWLVPESEQMVAQIKARTGRSIVPGSGGLIMSPARSEAKELYDEEKLKAFVKLVAGGIIPMKNGIWQEQYDLLPGLQPVTAARCLKVCLPLELVVRYLAKDGLFASKYVAALNCFTQPDHCLMPSEEKEPMSLVGWFPDVFEIYLGAGQHEAVVPIEAVGEARLAMHVISAIASGEVFVERWRPPCAFCWDDGFDSGDEKQVDRYGKGHRLRRVEPVLPVLEVPESSTQVVGWSFQPTSQSHGDQRRGGRFVDTARYRDAVARLEESLLEFAPRDVSEEVTPVDGTEGLSALPLPQLGTVESPGGSAVCLLPAETCQDMNIGRVLEPIPAVEVVVAAKPHVDRFVGSRLFDGFAGPWESILRSFADDSVMRHIIKVGEATAASAILSGLRVRFNYELVGVLKNSNVTRSRFRKLFSKGPKISTVMKAIENGDFSSIAQTHGFFKRVGFIKAMLVRAIDAAQRANFYLPDQVTEMQRMQYVQGVVGYGSVGQGQYLPYHPPQALPTSGARYLTRRVAGGDIGDVGSSGQMTRLARRFGSM